MEIVQHWWSIKILIIWPYQEKPNCATNLSSYCAYYFLCAHMVFAVFFAFCWTFITNLICEYTGEVATYRFQAKTRPKVFGKWGVWDGKFRKVATRAAATPGTYYILCSLIFSFMVSPLAQYFNRPEKVLC